MPVFLDSNIVLYALGDDDKKCRAAAALIEASPWVSTQVINECSHVLRRKLQWPPGKIDEHLSAILRLVQLADVGISEIRSAWALAERYGFGHYDSLIIAAALQTGSATLSYRRHATRPGHRRAADTHQSICVIASVKLAGKTPELGHGLIKYD